MSPLVEAFWEVFKIVGTLGLACALAAWVCDWLDKRFPGRK